MEATEKGIDYHLCGDNFEKPAIPILRSIETPVSSPPAELIIPDPISNYNFYSTGETWLQLEWAFQFPEAGSVQTLETPRTSLLSTPETPNNSPTDEPHGYYLLNNDRFTRLQIPTHLDYCHSESPFQRHKSSSPDNTGTLHMSTNNANYCLSSPQKCPLPKSSAFCINSLGIGSSKSALASNEQFERRSSTCAETPTRHPTSHEVYVDMGIGDLDQSQNNEPPYSQLIYRALKSAPGMTLSLQGIYSWFENNTAKGKGPSPTAWKSSIRHNLSMNAAFEAVREESPTKTSSSSWRLTEDAIRNGGVEPTTRYRRRGKQKQSARTEHLTECQHSGAKGGNAAEAAATSHYHDHYNISQPYSLSGQRL